MGELTLVKVKKVCSALSFIKTAKVGAGRCGPPPVDEDWHAVCQATYKGVEGAEWENLYFKFLEINKAVNGRHPSGNSRAKNPVECKRCQGERRRVLRPASEQKIANRDGVRRRNCGQTPPESSTNFGSRVAKCRGVGRRWLIDGGREQNLNIFSY